MTENPQKYSNVLPIWKFALFSVASLGIYELYWNYKSWTFFKKRDDLEISPFWRTFFMPLFMMSLFTRYSDMLKAEGYSADYPTLFLVFFWVGMNLISRYEDPIWLVSYLSFLAFIPVLNAVNAYWRGKAPGLPEKPLTLGQTVLLIAGVVFFSLFVMGTFIPA
ncbi:TPA: hypothetical protein HA351_06645 [Methanosarcinaceae archaeon]|nr:hypothetical protein [Methanosarcinaceae archaeon]